MEQIALWLTPLLLVPGVAMLVLSTSARYEAVHDEIHTLLEEGTATAASCAQHVLARARLFRNSLVALYGAVCVLGLAGLIGGVSSLWLEGFHWLATVGCVLGIALLIIAACILVLESTLSLKIVEAHTRELGERSGGNSPSDQATR